MKALPADTRKNVITPPQAGKKLAEAAFRWRRARVRYRKLLDSKSAKPKQLEKAKKDLLKLTNELEVVVTGFERFYRQMVSGTYKMKEPFPWQQALGVISVFTGAVSKAYNPGAPDPTPREPQTIDVEAEVVDVK